MSYVSRDSLRKQVRHQRQQLSSQQQIQASQAVLRQFITLPEIEHAQHIALYLTADGELDTQPLIQWLWQQAKHVYLPVIHPFSAGHLLFLHYTKDTKLTPNRYGILEPKLTLAHIKPVKELDIICTPLVAFDCDGQRLGMGGGYYDRTLAPWFHSQIGATPIGLAHDCQLVSPLPKQEWDIPLPKIITPSQIWQWES